MYTTRLLATILLLIVAPVAIAHPGHGHGGLGAGFLHPLVGLDHILAMLAVGLWATQQGGNRALWLVPAAFLGAMALGFSLGVFSAPVPLIELGIVGSLLVFGALVAFARRLPLVAAGGIAGLFALFHGHAHGAEMAAGASALAFARGFLASTALLLAVGVATGVLTRRSAWPLLRVGGVAVAVAGGYLLLAG